MWFVRQSDLEARLVAIGLLSQAHCLPNCIRGSWRNKKLSCAVNLSQETKAGFTLSIFEVKLASQLVVNDFTAENRLCKRRLFVLRRFVGEIGHVLFSPIS